jgi:hypothetical protein
MTEADLQSQLDEARSIIGQQMARIAELEAEVQNLKAGLSAHELLQSIYRTSASESARIRAATAALGHESAPLKAQEAPLDLVGEEVIPLADLVAERRARHERMMREPPYSTMPKAVPFHPNANSNGDDSSGD